MRRSASWRNRRRSCADPVHRTFVGGATEASIPQRAYCLAVDRYGVTLIGEADANCSVPDMVAVPVAAAGQTGPVPVRV